MELKTAIDNVKQAKTLLSEANNVMSVNVSRLKNLEGENAKLKQENAALKVELDDWKGNAEGFEPDAYMRLPVDADGVPIRLGDKVWYVGIDGEITKCEPQKVMGLVSVFGAYGTYIVTRDYPDKAIAPHLLTHNPPKPTDSWEKLADDVANFNAFEYCVDVLDIDTGDYTTIQEIDTMKADVLRRAKRLAGIEEREGGERTAIADKEEVR